MHGNNNSTGDDDDDDSAIISFVQKIVLCKGQRWILLTWANIFETPLVSLVNYTMKLYSCIYGTIRVDETE